MFTNSHIVGNMLFVDLLFGLAAIRKKLKRHHSFIFTKLTFLST